MIYVLRITFYDEKIKAAKREIAEADG